MAKAGTETERIASPHIFDCESLPIAPGTKSRARLARGPEEQQLHGHVWWLLGGTVVVALLVGAVIGRFLLP